MKILVESSNPEIGAYEKEVPDTFFDKSEITKQPTIEERVEALESENASLKKQLSAISKLNAG